LYMTLLRLRELCRRYCSRVAKFSAKPWTYRPSRIWTVR
jgi:hypothetical protein